MKKQNKKNRKENAGFKPRSEEIPQKIKSGS